MHNQTTRLIITACTSYDPEDMEKQRERVDKLTDCEMPNKHLHRHHHLLLHHQIRLIQQLVQAVFSTPFQIYSTHHLLRLPPHHPVHITNSKPALLAKKTS